MDSKPSTSGTTEWAWLGGRLLSIDRLEISVPRDAAVRLVPARDIPRPIMKKLGLLPAPRPTDSSAAMVTWISPVMVQEKGSQTGLPISHCSSQVWAWLTAALEACGSAPGSQRARCHLPITCSSLAAFKVLKEVLLQGGRGNAVGKRQRALDVSLSQSAPAGHAVRYCQDAFFVHKGHIFLSINRARCSESPPPGALPALAKLTSPRLPAPPASPPLTPAPPCPPSDPPGFPWRHICGVKRSAQVTVNKLPSALLERLRTAGQVRLEEQAPIGRLHSKADCKNTAGLFHSRGSQKEPGDTCSEGPSRCSGDRKRRVAYDLRRRRLEKGSKEPKPKKSRAAPHLVSTGVSGDISAGEGGVVSTGEGGNVSTGEDRDVGAGEVWGSDGRQVRGGGGGAEGGAGIQVLGEVCWSPPELDHRHGFGAEQFARPALGSMELPSPSLDFSVGFDFEQSARDEKIHRIRVQLREREAALKKLSHSV